MDTPADNLQMALDYLRAIEAGTTGDDLAVFFTADLVQEEFPNRLVANGAKRNLQDVLEGAIRGQKVLISQRYDVQNSIVSGDTVAMEVIWTGVMAVAFGAIPVGGEMKARFAVFLQFRDGKIAAQRNYDCFDPW